MKRAAIIITVVAIASQLGATDCGQVLRDPGFDLWCGESLCAWKIERGTIARVPTWHDKDSGVALGDDSAIEQLAPVNSFDATCITFDLVANIDNDAEVYLNVDIEGDGRLEMHERLPSSSWKPLSYSIALAAPYDGIRFELTKVGSGNAVLAQIGATTSDSCDGLTPLDPGPRPDGAACVTADDCTSSLCIPNFFGSYCSSCDPGQACPTAGDVCGLGVALSPILAVPRACVPAASVPLGARCLLDAECATAICNQGTCSSCKDSCPDASQCVQAWPITGPSVCDGASGAVASGQPCGADTDCASGRCNGTAHSECSDGRPCVTSEQCPVDSTLSSGACTVVGVTGGSCE